jgi:hypothetical protein
VIAELSALADTGTANQTLASDVLATRGERLILTRTRYTAGDKRTAYYFEGLEIVEVDSTERLAARVGFDLEDLDAAFAELDARYLAGEAAAHAHTWSLVTEAYAAFNRREVAPTAPDWVNVDHRHGAAFAAGDMIAYLQAAWKDSPDTRIYLEEVHRLSTLGAVVTHVAYGVSQQGFDAEWRDLNVITIDGNVVNRCELFDREDLDAALARFDELSR